MGDDGSATAEVAIVLPAVVLLLAMVLTAGAGAVTQVQCVDAARAGARMAARGEPSAAVVSAARVAAPHGATVTVAHGGATVTVRVVAPVVLPLPGVPALRVQALATARVESAG